MLKTVPRMVRDQLASRWWCESVVTRVSHSLGTVAQSGDAAVSIRPMFTEEALGPPESVLTGGNCGGSILCRHGRSVRTIR